MTVVGAPTPPRTAPACGPLRGLARHDVAVFKGIPFATADRFGPPIPVEPWTEERRATSYSPQCPQIAGMLDRALGGSSLPMAEDCLALNVVTPACDDAQRPVLVWIHGGAFVTGTGSMPWYEGSSLASRGDVVVVNVNYRLGAFGFTGTGNHGVLDQLAALEWVQRNIAAFGGDPTNVTVFGESAGGASVVTLLATGAAGQTFHRAWAMSPSITQLRDGSRAAEAAAALTKAAGVDDLDGLRGLTSERLLDAQREVLTDRVGAMTAFSPAVDGALLRGPVPETAAVSPVPLVVGTTSDEMQLFTAFDRKVGDLGDERLRRQFARQFGDRASDALDAYRRARPGATNGQLATALQTDETFRVPARLLADARADRGGATWAYLFTWPSPAFGGALGACHGLHIPFVFHNLDRPGVPAFTGDGPGRDAVADAFSGALLRFARHGDPGWTRYDTADRVTMTIDEVSREVGDPEGEIRELWR